MPHEHQQVLITHPTMHTRRYQITIKVSDRIYHQVWEKNLDTGEIHLLSDTPSPYPDDTGPVEILDWPLDNESKE